MFKVIKSIRNIVSSLGSYSKYVRWAYIVAVLEGFTIFVPYMLFFYTVDRYLNHSLIQSDFYIVISVIFASVFIRAILRRVMDKLQQDKGYYAFAEHRLRLAEHLTRLNMGYYSESNIGNMTSVITTDITFIEEIAMMQLAIAVSNIASIVPTTLMMFLFDVRLGAVYLVFLILSLISLRYLLKKMNKNARVRQDNQAALSQEVLTYVEGIQDIKAFNIGQEKSNEIDHVISKVKDGALTFVLDMTLSSQLTGLSLALPVAFIISLVSYYVISGTMPLASAIGMMTFSFILYVPINLLLTSSEMLELGDASIDRYKELMATKTLPDHADNPFRPSKMEIEFKNVNFAYEEKEVLKNINLRIRDKTFTALVGKSGSGKTTIANLIARFWDVSDGEITFDGVNLKDISYENLLENISMVFQRVYLFHDTIYNNIAFGRQDASREEVMEAAKKARCHDFIMKLENGYDTIVGEGGSTLSGGEKQRISIARAILKDAPLILLDEATAGIDPENETYIQEAIDELVKDKTLVVIAHRLATIRNADNIVFLENGRIVEQGTHEELIRLGGKYRRQHDFYLKNLEG